MNKLKRSKSWRPQRQKKNKLFVDEGEKSGGESDLDTTENSTSTMGDSSGLRRSNSSNNVTQHKQRNQFTKFLPKSNSFKLKKGLRSNSLRELNSDDDADNAKVSRSNSFKMKRGLRSNSLRELSSDDDVDSANVSKSNSFKFKRGLRSSSLRELNDDEAENAKTLSKREPSTKSLDSTSKTLSSKSLSNRSVSSNAIAATDDASTPTGSTKNRRPSFPRRTNSNRSLPSRALGNTEGMDHDDPLAAPDHYQATPGEQRRIKNTRGPLAPSKSYSSAALSSSNNNKKKHSPRRNSLELASAQAALASSSKPIKTSSWRNLRHAEQVSSPLQPEEDAVLLLLKKADRLVGEIVDVIESLKDDVVDISKSIAAMQPKMNPKPMPTSFYSSRQYTSTTSSMQSLKKLNRLELERQKVMTALDYLQGLRIRLLIQIDDAKDIRSWALPVSFRATSPLLFKLPSLEEIAEKVRAFLAGEEGGSENGDHSREGSWSSDHHQTSLNAVVAQEGWCLDNSRAARGKRR